MHVHVSVAAVSSLVFACTCSQESVRTALKQQSRPCLLVGLAGSVIAPILLGDLAQIHGATEEILRTALRAVSNRLV